MDQPAPSRRRRGLDPALATAIVVLTAVTAWARLDEPTRRTVWAEDGAVFLLQRLDLGPFDSLSQSYAGYLHLVPRLLTDVAVLVPLVGYPRAMTALCCFTVGLIAAGVYLGSHHVVHARWARVLLAALTVLVPAGPLEVLGNAANLHSFFLWLSPWLLLARPTRWWQAAALGVVALATTLTEIQCLVFAPLILWGIRDRRRWPVVVGFATGLVAQVAVTVSQPRPPLDQSSLSLLDLIEGYLLNVVLAVWNPSLDGPGATFARHGWGLAVLALVPFLLAAALALLQAVCRRGSDGWSGMLLLAVLVVGSGVPLVASLVLNAQTSYQYAAIPVDELAARYPLRYGVAPALFLLAIPVVASDLLTRSEMRWRRPLASGLTAALVVLVGVHLDIGATRRTKGPIWASGFATAVQSCEERGLPRRIRMGPTRQWRVLLSCSELQRR